MWFQINITNYTHQQNLEYKPHMVVDFHVDSCKWVDGSLVNKFMDILKHDMIKYGNTFTPCPQYVSCECVLKQCYLYRSFIQSNLLQGLVYMRNMTFSDQYFPPITPSGDNYLDFQFYSFIDGQVRRLYYLRPYLEIRYKGIFQW